MCFVVLIYTTYTQIYLSTITCLQKRQCRGLLFGASEKAVGVHYKSQSFRMKLRMEEKHIYSNAQYNMDDNSPFSSTVLYIDDEQGRSRHKNFAWMNTHTTFENETWSFVQRVLSDYTVMGHVFNIEHDVAPRKFAVDAYWFITAVRYRGGLMSTRSLCDLISDDLAITFSIFVNKHVSSLESIAFCKFLSQCTATGHNASHYKACKDLCRYITNIKEIHNNWTKENTVILD
jgi:hypothetical protein